jgi:hypothetical protein
MHVVFGVSVAFLLLVVIGLSRIWGTLDAGPLLRVLIIVQVLIVMSFAGATWRAAVLWVRLDTSRYPTPFPWRAPDTLGYVPVKRWRRAAALLWWAMFVNMGITALLLRAS